MAYYRDLRDYVEALEKHHALVKIAREINKDTELHPMVRWQFIGLQQKDRKAFLFENVTDVKGNRYPCPVLVSAYAPSPEVYAVAMACDSAGIPEKWAHARRNPIKPRCVDSGPAQEELHIADALLEHGGLGEFPVPISTPGFDNAPYLSAASWVSRDPETGSYNVGNYRGMIKSRTRVGCNCLLPKHMRIQWGKYRQKGLRTMPAAIVVGASPNIGLAAASKIPYGASEYDLAGGLAGAPVDLVKCRTVDIEVPANAEIVIEGEIPTDSLEPEGPFGEHTGYVGHPTMNLFLNVTAITHRRKPVFHSFISQITPHEGSLTGRMNMETSVRGFLKDTLGMANLIDVGFPSERGEQQFCVIRLREPTQADAWQALNGATAFMPLHGKVIVAVDEDIEPGDLDSVVWALCYRMQPDHDIRFSPGRTIVLDPSITPNDDGSETGERPAGSSMMINATRKWDYPPVSLPKREYMERARQLWEEEGLPRLAPKAPWYGYSLGRWTEENEAEAELALRGEHYATGEKLAQRRVRG